MIQARIETRQFLRQSDILPLPIVILTVNEDFFNTYLSK